MAIIGTCSCEVGNGNTGTPSCLELFGLANGTGMQNTVDGQGAVNEFDISTGSTIATDFPAALYDTDKTARIFPVSGLRNIDFPQEDDQFDTDNQNQKDFLRSGVIGFSAEKRGVNMTYAQKLNQSRCTKNSTWIFTENGVWGYKVSDYDAGTHVWRPLPMGAFSAKWMPKKGDAVEKVMMSFDFDQNIHKLELWMIPYDELGITLEDLKLAGILDVNFEITNAVATATETTFSLRLRTDYGQGIVDDQNVDGRVAADFTITNVTSGASITPNSVTEVPDDDYDFDIPNQTSADIVKVALATSSTNKYEGSILLTMP